MTRLRRPLAGLVLALCTASSFAADALALVHERLKLSPVLKGEFEQTKTLKGFKNPLVSHGDFLVARGQGVWWHTLAPFEATMVVTPTRLASRDAEGRLVDVVDAQAQPGLKQVNALILAVLSGDPQALADRFDAVAQPVGAAGWSLVLTPRDPGVARFLARATLTGERDVQTVRIQEAGGDTTQIRFSHQVPSAALGADEATRFR